MKHIIETWTGTTATTDTTAAMIDAPNYVNYVQYDTFPRAYPVAISKSKSFSVDDYNVVAQLWSDNSVSTSIRLKTDMFETSPFDLPDDVFNKIKEEIKLMKME